MQKLSFKKASDILAERRMNEHQMNLLKGGLRCISCHRDMEPSQMGESLYECSATILGGNEVVDKISAKTEKEACTKFIIEHDRVSNPYCRLMTADDPGYY